MLVETSTILLFPNNLTQGHCQLGCKCLTFYIEHIQVLELFKHKWAWKLNCAGAYMKLVLLILKLFSMFDCLTMCIKEKCSLFVCSETTESSVVKGNFKMSHSCQEKIIHWLLSIKFGGKIAHLWPVSGSYVSKVWRMW